MTRADSRFYLPSQASMPLRFLPYMTRNGDYICPSHIVVGLQGERRSTYLCAWGCYSTVQNWVGWWRGTSFSLLGGAPRAHTGGALSRKKVRLRRARHSYIVIVICFSKHEWTRVWLWKICWGGPLGIKTPPTSAKPKIGIRKYLGPGVGFPEIPQ